MTDPVVVAQGDGARDVVRVETWMRGLRVVDVIDFTDVDGQPWRQLTLNDGRVVQFLRVGPWLVLE